MSRVTPDQLISHLSSCSCCLSTDLGREDFGFYSLKSGSFSVLYRRFPTHLPSHVRKDGTNGKLYKISGQRIYDGSMHPMIRAKIMDGLKSRYKPLGDELSALVHSSGGILRAEGSVIIEYGVPVNYGDIRSLKGRISWLPPKPGYQPRWDLSNLWPMRKAIEDAMVDAHLMKDDNIAFVNEITERVVGVDHIDDRYIRFTFHKPAQ